MPTYDYRCDDCEAVFEVVHKMTETPQIVCEKCGSSGCSRLISATAFHLKGSGWYKTDYAKSGSNTTGGESSASDKTKTSDENPATKSESSKAKTESKPKESTSTAS